MSDNTTVTNDNLQKASALPLKAAKDATLLRWPAVATSGGAVYHHVSQHGAAHLTQVDSKD